MTDPLRAATNATIDAAEAASDPIHIPHPDRLTPADWDAVADRATRMWHDLTCSCCDRTGVALVPSIVDGTPLCAEGCQP